MGLIAEIQSPDIETRMAILQKKSEYEGMNLPADVIEYIASTYTNNIRELEGALIRAVAYVSISGLPMTVQNIEPILNPPAKSREVTPTAVLKVVCDEFNVSSDDLLGNSRKREISQARQIAMFLMRSHTDLSLPKNRRCIRGERPHDCPLQLRQGLSAPTEGPAASPANPTTERSPTHSRQ